MSVEATPEGGRRGGLEVRSIDYVPLNERHGKLWHLGPLWFMSNAQIATLAVGVLGVERRRQPDLVADRDHRSASSSAPSSWPRTRAQGPQLGLPQMIQSRPQFGYVGAILVWLFAYLQYAGFNVFNTLLAARLDAHHRATAGRSSGSSSAPSLAAVGRDRRLRLHPPDGAGR